MLNGKTWRWFTTRLFGLTLDSRLWQALLVKPKTDAEVVDDMDEVDRAMGVERE